MSTIQRYLFKFRNTEVLIGGAMGLVLLIWLFAFVRVWQDKQFVIEKARATIQNTAISFKEHSLASIRNTDEALRIIKYHFELNGSKDFALLNGYFDQGVIDVRFLNQVGIINEQGIYEYSNLKNQKPVDLSDREHFRIHKEGLSSTPLFISRPVMGRASGKWSIQVTRRMNYPDGRFKGVAVASFDPHYFLDYYREIDLGPGTLIGLMGTDGYVRTLRIGGLMHYDDSMQQIALPESLRNADQGWFFSDALFDHVKRLYVFVKLNEQPLVVLVGMREGEVLAEYTRLRNTYVMAAGLLSVLILLFVRVAIYYIRHSEQANAALQQSYEALDAAKQHESHMSARLSQSEKMAALGQLAAGVAHEINNPMSFVSSNLNTLRKYTDVFRQLLDATQQHAQGKLTDQALDDLKKKLNLDFVVSDLHTILDETQEGVLRVKHIVADLKNFSRGDPKQTWVMADLKPGILSTLNIVNHEIKYRADVAWDWQDLPPIECIPSQLNQVFLNLIVNAAQAMPEGRRGLITLRSGVAQDQIWIEVQDNGSGMPPQVIKRIFEPFFTTKETGGGTGLGLSVSLGIVQTHHGQLQVDSHPEQGTRMRVTLPIRQPTRPSAAQASALATATENQHPAEATL